MAKELRVRTRPETKTVGIADAPAGAPANRHAQREGTLAGMPVGRRTPRGKRRWYLVHAPGREQATCDKVRKLIPHELLEDAFVMRRERVKKYHGEWVTSTTLMYPEYFFVVTRDVNALDKALSKLSFPARVCKGENRFYAPLSSEAQAWYEQMMDATHTIRTSTAVIVDGELQIQEGPMVGQEARVTRIMRQKSVCTVAVGEGGSAFTECVPFVVPFKS